MLYLNLLKLIYESSIQADDKYINQRKYHNNLLKFNSDKLNSANELLQSEVVQAPPKILGKSDKEYNLDIDKVDNVSDLEILKKHYFNHIKSITDDKIKENIKTKIKHINTKINELTQNKINSEQAKSDVEFHSKELDKIQQDDEKLNKKIVDSKVNIKNFNPKTDNPALRITKVASNAHSIYKLLTLINSNKIDKLQKDILSKQLHKDMADFILQTKELSKQIKELEQEPGFHNKVNINKLKSQIESREKFIAKIGERT